MINITFFLVLNYHRCLWIILLSQFSFVRTLKDFLFGEFSLFLRWLGLAIEHFLRLPFFILLCYNIGKSFERWRNSYVSYRLVTSYFLNLIFVRSQRLSTHLSWIFLGIQSNVRIFLIWVLTLTGGLVLVSSTVLIFIQNRVLLACLFWDFVDLRESWLDLVVSLLLLVIDTCNCISYTLRGTSIHHFNPISWN